ncbi:MAG: peroxide stress protein YaaA [Flavobacteriaceae bacterium]|nr:peroxide stress protein YaaA [Flavobacteriaceae bacterium]
MKILLSPAKTLDFQTKVPTLRSSKPIFVTQANEINQVLQSKTPKKLMDLMDISDKLAQMNWKRNQEWEQTSDLRQAVYAFKGEVYVGLDAYSISELHWDYMQNSVRILSGQYGVLKPFDLIKPYRLEMGSDLKIGKSKNLYQYWDANITQAIQTELALDEWVVNLASQEYFKVIKSQLLQNKIITPIFKDYKNGDYKVISFFAKKARGLMTRFAIDHRIEKVNQLKTFSDNGYAFDDKLSSETEWVFTR